MAKKDYAAELAELRAQLEEVEQEAAEHLERFKRADAACEQIESEVGRLKCELNTARAEIMRVKAHAYDLMMEREAP